MRLIAVVSASFLALSACSGGEQKQRDPGRLYTPRWSFSPWISKDISDGPDTRAFLKGFQDRDIPVGVMVIDSPWDVNYTTFQVNPERYPGFPEMVSEFRDQGVRTVMWTTQMVNEDSFDLEDGGDVYDGAAISYLRGEREGYLVNDAETYLWWKGKGAGVDFHNEAAMEWWHKMQDSLLDLGIAGWKLDFGESYIETPMIKTAQGEITHQAYSEKYYEDFLKYGVERQGAEEFVTMVRAYDKSYHFEGRFFARPEHAPISWMGDNRRDWIGLEDAMDHLFRSARAGYAVIGSDIGGYLDLDDADLRTPVPFDVLNFNRWTAVGAMTPFMQLHGRSNIAPWTVPERQDLTVEIYRYWSWLHEQLVPFFYSLAEEAHAGGPVIMHPIGDESDWAGDYRFLVGEAFFVAPILDETGVRNVPLPGGARWYDWFDEGAQPLMGDETLMDYDATDERRIPLFVREGAIIPMEVDNSVTSAGSEASKGMLTLLLYPSAQPSRFVLHGETEAPVTIELQQGQVELPELSRGVILKVRAESAPSGPARDGESLQGAQTRAALEQAEEGWFYDAERKALWIKLRAGARTVTF